MSSLLASAKTRSSGAPRPQLDVVPVRAREARRVPFVALVVGMLTIGLVGLLVLNTSLQRGAYVVTDLRGQAAALTLQQQHLQVKVAELQAPQRVAEGALEMGMVQGDNPAFLSLTTGKVTGVPQPGQAGDQVDLGSSIPAVSSASKASPLWAGTNNSGTTGLERAQRDEPPRRSASPGPRSVR